MYKKLNISIIWFNTKDVKEPFYLCSAWTTMSYFEAPGKRMRNDLILAAEKKKLEQIETSLITK